ncbi:hypothetical protein V9T40_012384 [Parthenolecanium corni]|uniref:Biogenesis of lysosome-related organelles complex 1 subunit 3 n=1 Tax=Parthenolecanium corni TaxID=536013 RepID=A0AAN9TB02_9HEMI
MQDDGDPTLVLGEAPESDDECDFTGINTSKINFDELDQAMKTSVTGSEVLGEAVESDEEVVFHNTAPSNITRNTASPASTKKQYPNSVRKLYQKNKELSDSLASFKKQIFSSAKHELNSVNQQLLKSQIELQQTLMNLRTAKSNLSDYKKKLNNIIVANYIPSINIQTPPNV